MQDNLSMDGGNAFLYTLGHVWDNMLMPLLKLLCAMIKSLWNRNRKERVFRRSSGMQSTEDFEKLANKYGEKPIPSDMPFGLDKDGNPIGLYYQRGDEYFNLAGEKISLEAKEMMDLQARNNFEKLRTECKSRGIPFTLIPKEITKTIRVPVQMPVLDKDGNPVMEAVIGKDGNPVMEDVLDDNGNLKKQPKMQMKMAEEMQEIEVKTTQAVAYHFERNAISFSSIQLEESVNNMFSPHGTSLDLNALEDKSDGRTRIELSQNDRPLPPLLEMKESMEKVLNEDKNQNGIPDGVEVMDALSDGMITKEEAKVIHSLAENINEQYQELVDKNKGKYDKKLENAIKKADLADLFSEYTIAKEKDGKIRLLEKGNPEHECVIENDSVLYGTMVEFVASQELGLSKDEIKMTLTQMLDGEDIVDFVNHTQAMVERNLENLLGDDYRNLDPHTKAYMLTSIMSDDKYDISLYKDCKDIVDIHYVHDAKEAGLNVAKMQENKLSMNLYPAMTSLYLELAGRVDEASHSIMDVKKEDVERLMNTMYSGHVGEIPLTPSMVSHVQQYVLDCLDGKNDLSMSDITFEKMTDVVRHENLIIHEVTRDFLADKSNINKAFGREESVGELKDIALARASSEMHEKICGAEMHNLFEGLGRTERERKLAFQSMQVQKGVVTINNEPCVLVQASKPSDIPNFKRAFKGVEYYVSQSGAVYCQLTMNENLVKSIGKERMENLLPSLPKTMDANDQPSYLLKDMPERNASVYADKSGNITLVKALNAEDYIDINPNDERYRQSFIERNGSIVPFAELLPQFIEGHSEQYLSGYESLVMIQGRNGINVLDAKVPNTHGVVIDYDAKTDSLHYFDERAGKEIDRKEVIDRMNEEYERRNNTQKQTPKHTSSNKQDGRSDKPHKKGQDR